MIDIFFTIVLIIVLLLIFWQDMKDRMVYWLLYMAAGILAFVINYKNVGAVQVLMTTAINLTLVVIIIVISFLYSKIIMKKRFLNESIGSGDLLFFICLPCTFAPVAFIVLFVFSLLFSLVLYVSLNAGKGEPAVPLAGYIALFFAVIYAVSLFIEPRFLFS